MLAALRGVQISIVHFERHPKTKVEDNREG